MNGTRLAVIVVLLGCAGEPPPPSGVLDRAKFKEVLLEAQLIEARVTQEMVAEKRVDAPVLQYYDSLFASEGVTRDQFKASFDHYAQRPEELKAIYEEILVDLGRRKDGRH